MFSDRVTDLVTFYNALSQIEERQGGRRSLATTDREPPWPARGIYFFFEPGETRSVSGSGDRIVRVASHSFGANTASRSSATCPARRTPRPATGSGRSAAVNGCAPAGCGTTITCRATTAASSWRHSAPRRPTQGQPREADAAAPIHLG